MRHYVAWVSRVKAVVDLHSKNLRTRISNYCAWRLAKWQLLAVLIWTRSQTLLGNVAISLFAVSAAALVLRSSLVRPVADFSAASARPCIAVIADSNRAEDSTMALLEWPRRYKDRPRKRMRGRPSRCAIHASSWCRRRSALLRRRERAIRSAPRRASGAHGRTRTTHRPPARCAP